MTIAIEKDIPAPTQRGKYPFARMEVGDSFLFPPGTTINRASASVAYAKKVLGNGHQFTCRQVPEGVRVWRVA